MMLDKTSPLPMYYQIEEDIKKRVKEGIFVKGESIPSERELSDYYEVSRMTVRQAVTNLVNKGLLYREKGKGTFVSNEKIIQPLGGLTSFTEDMRQRGMKASNQLLQFSQKTAEPAIAEVLELDEAESVYEVQRVRLADQQPMALETTYIPVRLFPDLKKEKVLGSFYHYVETEWNKTIGKASQSIQARMVTNTEAMLLKTANPSAVLVMERTSFLQDGVPFEFVQSVYRADRYQFISEIERI